MLRHRARKFVQDEDDHEEFLSDEDENQSDADSEDDTFVNNDVKGRRRGSDDDVLLCAIKKIACDSIRQLISGNGGAGCSKKRQGAQKFGAFVESDTTKALNSRFNVTYFANTIAALTPYQKGVIKNYGFGVLLDFDRCSVPFPFVRWIADHVRTKTTDIVVNNCSISLSPEGVHDVIGLNRENEVSIGRANIPNNQSTRRRRPATGQLQKKLSMVS